MKKSSARKSAKTSRKTRNLAPLTSRASKVKAGVRARKNP